MANEIKSSGSMQEFASGAHRDNATGKGDCSLLPLEVVGMVMYDEPVISSIAKFMDTRDYTHLIEALRSSMETIPNFRYNEIVNELALKSIEVAKVDSQYEKMKSCLAHAILEASIQYEQGSLKYGRWNWILGWPVNRTIDSAVRHYLKVLRGDVDEPHYRAFVWNILCAVYICIHKPELNFKEEPELNGKGS